MTGFANRIFRQIMNPLFLCVDVTVIVIVIITIILLIKYHQIHCYYYYHFTEIYELNHS